MSKGLPREIAAVSVPHLVVECRLRQGGTPSAHPVLVEKIHPRVTGYLQKYSPLGWSQSPGLYLLELTGTARLFGRALDTCGRIIRDLDRRFQLAACIGIGSTPLVARLAARLAGPHGVYQIPARAGRQAVGQLSIRWLPHITRKTKEELVSGYGIRYVRDLSLFSREDLTCLFGEEGEVLWSCSRTLTRKSLTQGLGEKIIRGEIAIDREGGDDRVVRRSFFRLLSDLAARLREEDLFPQAACLQVVYRDDYRFTRRVRLRRPGYFETGLYPQLIDHVNRALERRVGVKRMIVVFTRFIPAYHQLDLFPEYAKPGRFLRACDALRRRFGRECLRLGT